MPEPIQSPPSPPKLTRGELSRLGHALMRTVNLLRRTFAQLLLVNDERKLEIYKGVFRNAEIADLNYWLEILFSIGIATLGLIMNSPAIVIGAMLLSPLMGPIIASGLAVALGDFYLGIRALLNVVLSSLGSILLAALITWILPFRTPTNEILSRVQPTLLDLAVAVMSGMIGAIVVCRGGQGGGVTAIPGVAVAVALMPPLGVVGFGVGIGWDWPIIRGGGLLYLTNLVAIIFSSFLVFFSVRMDTDSLRRRIDEWLETTEKDEQLYEALQRTPLRRLLGRVGTLPRRIAALLIFLAMVAVPLGRTLNQLREEANIRRIILDELGRTLRSEYPETEVVRQEIEIHPSHVRVGITALFSQRFAEDARVRLRERISSRIGRPVQLSLYEVATRDELRAIASTAGSRPGLSAESFDAIREHLWERLRPALTTAWPTEQAPLVGYALELSSESEGIVLQLTYLGEQDLGPLGEQAMARLLGDRIGTSHITLRLERIAPTWDVTFPRGSRTLPPAARQLLDRLAEILQRFPRIRCVLLVASGAAEGGDGSPPHRAEQVRSYLINQSKVAAERIELRSHSGSGNRVRVQLVLQP
jgi:uncharacterized hydrophobic protein (TIGR00271 family)